MIIETPYRNMETTIAVLWDISFSVRTVFLPCALSSLKSFVWFHKFDAKLESTDTAIPKISRFRWDKIRYKRLYESINSTIAKNGTGEKIELGV